VKLIFCTGLWHHQLSGGRQRNYSTKTRQAGRVIEHSISFIGTWAKHWLYCHYCHLSLSYDFSTTKQLKNATWISLSKQHLITASECFLSFSLAHAKIDYWIPISNIHNILQHRCNKNIVYTTDVYHIDVCGPTDWKH
jgi:hypothetical protein